MYFIIFCGFWPPPHQYKFKNGIEGFLMTLTVVAFSDLVQSWKEGNTCKKRAYRLWVLYTRINSGLLPTTSILVLRQNMRPQDFRPDYKSRWLKVLHNHVFISFIRSQAESSFLTITGDTNIPFSLILSTVCYIIIVYFHLRKRCYDSFPDFSFFGHLEITNVKYWVKR